MTMHTTPSGLTACWRRLSKKDGKRRDVCVCVCGGRHCSDRLSIPAQGVASVILRHSTPRPVRAKIAELLNAKRERLACKRPTQYPVPSVFCLLELRFQWTLNEDGTVDTGSSLENTDYCSQFEWLSKGMDAEQARKTQAAEFCQL